MVNKDEAERVREIFTICAGCPTLASAERDVTARGFRTKEWTSKRGQQHRARAFNQCTLGALLRKVFYIGQVRHQGVIYPGEQPAIIDRELWSRVQAVVPLQTRTGAPRRKLDVLLSGLLYCAQCGERMGASFASSEKRRHLYYVCRTGKKREPRCRQKPVASADLEASLFHNGSGSAGKRRF